MLRLLYFWASVLLVFCSSMIKIPEFSLKSFSGVAKQQRSRVTGTPSRTERRGVSIYRLRSRQRQARLWSISLARAVTLVIDVSHLPPSLSSASTFNRPLTTAQTEGFTPQQLNRL